MELIKKYFPGLTETQIKQFEALMPLYAEWNEKINVISRKDIENLYEHHVLHSLAIAKFMNFKDGTRFLDLGTGGGFPGVPMAILLPECNFVLVDSINKKLNVINEVAQAIGLKNIVTRHSRVEDLKKEKFDFVITRAVATIDKLLLWSRKSISDKHINIIPNGIIALKGINLKEEMKLIGRREYSEIKPLKDYFSEAYFDEKALVYVQG
jgi:16S rRNA (guanine527-N7)-methyltransferase